MVAVDSRERERRCGISKREAGHASDAIGVGVLYDAVGIGMAAYRRAAFRVTTIAPPFRLRPQSLVLVTHRRETDVPVAASLLYFRSKLWRHRSPRMSFAARDDMFLPGFFAGFPPDLPTAGRKLLFPVGIGHWLPRVEVHPLPSASVARLGEVVRARSDEGVIDVLGPEEAAAFAARAAACRLPEPARAGDLVRGEYADLLWRPVSRSDRAAVGMQAFWSRRAARAARDFRSLVELVRAGGVLVLFPEGRPSPDGEIGPVQRGLSALVRRAQPHELLPVALAYDPLTRGRTRLVVAIGPPAPTPVDRIEDETLALLRRTMPLTVGQVVSASLAAKRDARGLAAEAVEEARVAGRPVEPDLVDPRRGERRLAEALAIAERKRDAVSLLAREYGSAREGSG